MNYKTQVINGTTYAFTDKSIWNSEKKRCEHKRKYIGKVVDGMDAVDEIAETEVDWNDKPTTPQVMKRVYIED